MATLMVCSLLVPSIPGAYSQETADDFADVIRQQQEIIRQQQQQIDELTRQVQELRELFLQSHPQEPEQPSHAQKEATKSGFRLKWYGFLRADMDIDTDRMFLDAQLPFWVRSPDDPNQSGQQTGDFTISPRLSRVGFDLTTPPLGGWESTGKLETDFYNAFITEGKDITGRARAALRIRLAYMQLKRGAWTFRAGQDWETISPLMPGVNYETLMWDAGNTGARRPLVKAIYRPGGDGPWTLETSIGAGGTVDDRDRDGDGFRDVETSQLPVLQARAGYSGKTHVEDQNWEAGLWGHYGQMNLNKGLEPPQNFGGYRHFINWVVGGDLSVPITPQLTARGEAWTGENLTDVRGGVGQCVNSFTGEEIDSTGGWLELRYRPGSRHQVHLGYTIDNPDDNEIAPGGRRKNQVYYITDWIRLNPSLQVGVELSRWQTDYLGLDTGRNLRTSLYIQQNF